MNETTAKKEERRVGIVSQDVACDAAADLKVEVDRKSVNMLSLDDMVKL